MSQTLSSAEAGPDFLRIKIDHSQPIELSALSSSMGALSGLFARAADAQGLEINDDKVRLYVTKVEAGSIILELQPLAQNLQLFTQDFAALTAFCESVFGIIRFCKGLISAVDAQIDKKDAQDAVKLLEPVAQDGVGSLTISHCQGVNVVVNQYNVNSEEANAGQNRLKNLIANAKAEIMGLHREQLFYFYQARDVGGSPSGDKGIVEAISRKPVKTIFSSEDVKEKLLHEPLFTKAYVVDVEVQTIGDQPKLYKILRVIESFDKD